MRPWTAALIGGLSGALVATTIVALQPRPAASSTPAVAPLSNETVLRAIQRIEERLDRAERSAAQRNRTGAATSATPPDAVVVSEPSGRVLSDDAVQSAAPADLSKVASADLALEADDRHANDFDISGAAKRYRELLARAGTPAELRHWHIRLGDCYFRLGMTEDAMREYRNCVDASTEDHGERVGCMIALAKNARTADPADARRWIDRALELEQGRSNRTVHEMAVFLARDASQTDVEVRELTWLVEHFPDEANAGAGWKERISDLRGEKR